VLLRGFVELFHIGFSNLHVLTALVAVVVIGSGFVYRNAAAYGLFVPSDSRIYLDEDLRRTCAPECAALKQTCGSSPAAASFVRPNEILVPRYSYLGRRQKFWPLFQYLDYSQSVGACLGACRPSWTSNACALDRRVPEYPAFSPYLYAVDAVMPFFVDLHQRDSWNIARNPSVSEGGLVHCIALFEGVFFWFWVVSVFAVMRSTLRRD
ncbi:MAG: hypothetical protein PHE27_06380, partial [Alphaproteobacteria bacterium]|nr:hypothetical protein [Alphaproteobacteria bacterium]